MIEEDIMIFILKPVNVIQTSTNRLDPSLVLSKDCLDVFYETIHDFEIKNKSKLDNSEWNELIFKIRQLDEQFVYVS